MANNYKRKGYTHYNIALYWNSTTLDFLQNKSTLFDYLELNINSPECFACGWRRDKKEYQEETYCQEEQRRMWNNSKLERHHIVPLSLGGEDQISNIVLLCGNCHLKVPHNRLITLKQFACWAYDVNYYPFQRTYELFKSIERAAYLHLNNECERNDFFHFISSNGKELSKVLTDNNIAFNRGSCSDDSISLQFLHEYQQAKNCSID